MSNQSTAESNGATFQKFIGEVCTATPGGLFWGAAWSHLGATAQTRHPNAASCIYCSKTARMHTDSGCCQRMFLHLHERLEQPRSRHHGAHVFPTHCGSWSISCRRARSSSTPTRETDRFLLDDTFASTGLKTSGRSF